MRTGSRRLGKQRASSSASRYDARIFPELGKRFVKPVRQQTFDMVPIILDRALASMLSPHVPVTIALPGLAQSRIARTLFGGLRNFRLWSRINAICNRPQQSPGFCSGLSRGDFAHFANLDPTNLGVRGSNPFGSAIKIRRLSFRHRSRNRIKTVFRTVILRNRSSEPTRIDVGAFETQQPGPSHFET